MLGHYITIALRSFARQTLHALLAIASLALGLACFVAAYVAITYIGSGESHFPKAERTYAIYQGMRYPNGTEVSLLPLSALALAEALRSDLPQLDSVARARFTSSTVAAGDKRVGQSILAVDREFLEIFDLEFVAGNAAGALQHGTAVATESTALELFGTRDIVGRTIEVGNGIELTVSGVIAPPAPPTHLGNSYLRGGLQWLVPMDVNTELFPAMQRNPQWSAGFPNFTYALLPADGSFTARDLNAALATLGDRHVPKDFGTIELEARHVSRLAIDFFQSIALQRTANVMSVPAMLLALGSLALGIAVLNFVTLTTGQTVRRAREVGVRKVLGATPVRIACQHVVETLVTVSAAFAVALALVGAAAVLLQRRSIAIDFASLPWGELAAFALVLIAGVTLLASAYPALVLSRARTMHALALGILRGGSRLVRAALVGTQFAAAGLLLLAVIVMYAQHAQLERNALPRTDDAFMTVYANFSATGVSYDTFAAELERSPHVAGMTGTGVLPWSVTIGAGPMYARSKDAAVETVALQSRAVGYDYFETLAMEVVAGRSFARDRQDAVLATSPGEPPKAPTAPIRVVLDRDAVARFGWSDPRDAIGQMLYSGAARAGEFEIIGVVESLPLTLAANGEGFLYQLAPSVTSGVIVRLARDSIAAGVADVEAAWSRLAPGAPLRHFFLDEGFRGAYQMFATVNRLFVALAAFVLFLASAGLFGIASYRVRSRLREIGVRKIVGATRAQILRLMLWDFAKPVLIANLLVWPLGFVAMQMYLAMFAQRIALTPLPFALSLGAVLAIAWLAAGIHVAAAARVQPAAVLRQG